MEKRIVVETWKSFDELDTWQKRAEFKNARKNTYLINSYYSETDDKLFKELDEITGKHGFTITVFFGETPKIEILNNDDIYWDDAGECFRHNCENPSDELLDFVGELNMKTRYKVSDTIAYYVDLITRSLDDDVVFELWVEKYWKKIGEEFMVSRQFVGKIDE